MALVTVGNSHIGNKYLYEYEYEFEDDDGECYYEYIEMEFWLDGWFAGYWIRLATATYENKIKLHIYQRYPIASDYEEYIGHCDIEICPVVYKCDSSGTFTELMNSEVAVVTKPETYSGWIDCEVTLKRNLDAGDYVFGGFYVFSANPVWDESSSGINGTIIERMYYSSGYTSDYIAGIIRDGTILSNKSKDLVDLYNYSLYFQYYNSPIRTDYVINVSSDERVNSSLSRKSKWKRSKTESESVSESIAKRFCVFRAFPETTDINDFSERNIEAIRNFLENEIVRDVSVRSVDLARDAAENNIIEDSAVRSAKFFKRHLENISVFDFAARFFGLVCKVFSVGGGSECLEQSGKYKREESSESNCFEGVVAGRVVFRVVSTVFGLWDWLKSKIRNENCVVELFTPITDELKIDN